jgi:hypothetical protein
MRRFQDLADAVAKVLDVRSAVFDGEILVMGESSPDFLPSAVTSFLRRPPYPLWKSAEDSFAE